MIIYKYYRDIRKTFHSTLINRFIQDGVGYFFIVFGLIMWNVFFGLFAPPTYSGIPRHWTLVIQTMCANRLVMNLKKAGEKNSRPHPLQGTDTPNPSSGTGQSWSGKKSATSGTVKPPAVLSYQYDGPKGTAVGAMRPYNVIEMTPTPRGPDTMMAVYGDRRHPNRTWGNNSYV